VRASIQRIKHWEKLQLRDRYLQRLSQGDDHLCVLTSGDRELKKHLVCRQYLIAHMLEWKTPHPQMFTRALNDLKIDPFANDSQEQFRRAVTEHFSLSGYLALNLENGVVDSTQIHSATWGAIIFLLAMFALLHRLARVSIVALIPWFIGAACVLLLSMVVILRLQRRQITQFTDACMKLDAPEVMTATSGIATGSTEAKTWLQQMYTIHQNISSERMMLRLLQVGLFFLCYCFARILVDVYEWQNDTTTTLLFVMVAIVLLLLLAYSLPRTVPNFLAVTALPPYVDPVNLEFMIKQLLDDHMDTQGKLEHCDGGMVSEKAAEMGFGDQTLASEYRV